jgi:hypothetical protein
MAALTQACRHDYSAPVAHHSNPRRSAVYGSGFSYSPCRATSDASKSAAGRGRAKVLSVISRRFDRAGLLGDVDEMAGPEQSPARVLPAHQRLDAHYLARVAAHQGLVEHPQLIAFDAVPQFARQGQARRAVRVDLRA